MGFVSVPLFKREQVTLAKVNRVGWHEVSLVGIDVIDSLHEPPLRRPSFRCVSCGVYVYRMVVCLPLTVHECCKSLIILKKTWVCSFR